MNTPFRSPRELVEALRDPQWRGNEAHELLNYAADAIQRLIEGWIE